MFASTVTKMCLPITNHPHFEWLPQCYDNVQTNYRLVTFWVYPVLGPPCTLSGTCRFHSEYAPRSIPDVFSDHIQNVSQMEPIFWVTFWILLHFSMCLICVQNVPDLLIWIHWGHMTEYILNVLNIYPTTTLNSHLWVYFKCAQFFTTGHIVITLVLIIQNAANL